MKFFKNIIASIKKMFSRRVKIVEFDEKKDRDNQRDILLRALHLKLVIGGKK